MGIHSVPTLDLKPGSAQCGEKAPTEGLFSPSVALSWPEIPLPQAPTVSGWLRTGQGWGNLSLARSCGELKIPMVGAFPPSAGQTLIGGAGAGPGWGCSPTPHLSEVDSWEKGRAGGISAQL